MDLDVSPRDWLVLVLALVCGLVVYVSGELYSRDRATVRRIADYRRDVGADDEEDSDMTYTPPGLDVPICPSGKHPHRTEQGARGAFATAKRLQWNGRRVTGSGTIFECKACGWWHFSAMTTKRRTRRT